MTKPIAFVTGYHDGYPVIQPVDGAAVLPTGMALYTHPPVAPDVQKPVGKFAKFADGVWREVTKGSAGVPLYEHPPAADVQELVEALQRIINAVPAGDGCGGFFIEHCDQDGNYIDTESVNPFDVALTLHSIAQEALAKWEGK